MRLTHIEYLKALRDEIGFSGKCLEVVPRTDEVLRELPVCVVYPRTVVNSIDPRVNTRVKQLPSVENADGTKDFRYVHRYFKQEYTYQIVFFLQGDAAEGEILSAPLAEGFIDKALHFIHDNRFVNRYSGSDVLSQIEVSAGNSGMIYDEAGQDVYKAFLDVIFQDGLYEEELVRSLTGGTLQTETPVEIDEV